MNLFRKPANPKDGGLVSYRTIWRKYRIQASSMSGERGMGGVCGQEVIDGHRHLDISKGPRGMVKLQILVAVVSVMRFL